MAYIERNATDRIQINSAEVNVLAKTLVLFCTRQIYSGATLVMKKPFTVGTDTNDFALLAAADRKIVGDFIDLLFRIIKTKTLINEATGTEEVIGGIIK